MKGLFIFTSICSLTGFFPLILGVKKIKLINNFYHTFIIYISIACLTEVTGRLLLLLHKNEFATILSNIYVFVEGLFFLILFLEWGILKNKSTFYLLLILLTVMWLTENVILNSIKNINSSQIIIYSIFTVILSTQLLQKRYFNNQSYFSKDPLAIISTTFIINYTYRAVFESIYLFKLNFSNSFYFNAFLIFIILNVFSNCTYTYAIHCMSQRKRLTSFY